MKGRLHPDADAEFADAVRYYSEIDPDLGVRFYREIERLIRDVCAHPNTFASSILPPGGTSARSFLTRLPSKD